MAANREQLNAWETQAVRDGESLELVLDEDRVLILGSDGANAPEPKYTAAVVAEHHALDLAVLRITGDEFGATLTDAGALPFVPLGDSSSVRQGDHLDLFGYPVIGGGTLTYTDGVVSGFNFEEGIDGAAWIMTNATMAGGSSGGAAIDRAGQLIGIPT
jgi:S1-C subfamily serine protease